MATVTISKKEYKDLVEAKLRYDYLRYVIDEDISASPPTHSLETVFSAFKATKRYNKRFLEGLKKGLRRSPHFR